MLGYHRRGLALQRAEFRLRVQRRQRRQLHRGLVGRQHLPLPVGPAQRARPRHRAGRPERLAVREGPVAAATGTWTMPRRSTPTSTSSERRARAPAASAPRRSSPTATRTLAAKGLLKDGKTQISEIVDGTSNTIAIIECAGRDERFVSQFFEGQYPVVRGQGPAGGPTARHRYWRWADPGCAFGTSGQPNNKGVPTNEGVPWPTHDRDGGKPGRAERGAVFLSTRAASTPSSATARSGSSRTPSTSSAFRSILTLAGGETVSADQY